VLQLDVRATLQTDDGERIPAGPIYTVYQIL